MKKNTNWKTQGEGYVDICVFVIVFAVFMMFSFSVFSIFTERVTMGQIADKVLEEAVKSGLLKSDEIQIIMEPYIQKGYQIEVTSEPETVGTEVQLGDKICVTVKKSAYLMGWGTSGKELCLKVQKEGCSERYWKPQYSQ